MLIFLTLNTCFISYLKLILFSKNMFTIAGKRSSICLILIWYNKKCLTWSKRASSFECFTICNNYRSFTLDLLKMHLQLKIQRTPIKLGLVLLPSAYTVSKLHMKGYHSIINITTRIRHSRALIMWIMPS